MSVVRWASQPLGIVVQVGNWRFVVHHVDCNAYLRSHERNRNRPVSPGMRLVVCGTCRPSEGEVQAFLPAVTIFTYSHGGFGARRLPFLPSGDGR